MTKIKNELISILKSKILENSRNLTKDEVLSIITENQVKKYFGKIDRLLNILPNKLEKEELIELLKRKVSILGRTPHNTEMDFPQAIVYIDKFGSWVDALKASGLEYAELPKDVVIESKRYKKCIYDKESIITIIKKQYQSTGKVPTKTTIIGVSVGTVKNHFGSFEDAIIEAGFTPVEMDHKTNTKKFDKDKIINLLKDQYERTGIVPTALTFEGISSSTVRKNFGSFENALIEADLSNKERLNPKQKELMTKKIIKQQRLINNLKVKKETEKRKIESLMNQDYILLKHLLKINKVQQKQFAEDIGLTESVVNNWCASRGFIHQYVLDYIEERFGVDKNKILPQKFNRKNSDNI